MQVDYLYIVNSNKLVYNEKKLKKECIVKKNPYLYVLVFIIVFFGIEFGIIHGCLKTTRLYPKTEIVLNLEAQHLDEYGIPHKISEESIEEIEKVLKNASLYDNQNELLEVFDKERNFYINFITLISVVLSVLGIAPVVYGIFEKNENIKLREDLEKIKKEYDLELGKLKIIQFFNKIEEKCDSFKKGSNLLLKKKTQVKTIYQFDQYNISWLYNALKEIDISLICDDNMIPFAIRIYNLMTSIIYYEKKHFNIFPKRTEINKVIVEECQSLNNLFILIRNNFLPKQFDEFINSILDIPNCKFDLSGL